MGVDAGDARLGKIEVLHGHELARVEVQPEVDFPERALADDLIDLIPFRDLALLNFFLQGPLVLANELMNRFVRPFPDFFLLQQRVVERALNLTETSIVKWPRTDCTANWRSVIPC